jgi:hypothetical protein
MKTQSPYERWIEALESGNYEKATGQLRKDDTFCCLGVACDITDFEKWHTVTRTDGRDKIPSWGSGHASKFLPESVRLELGLRTKQGTFNLKDISKKLREEIITEIRKKIPGSTGEHLQGALTAINDNVLSFDVIVKILKERPPSLFLKQKV